MKFAVTLVALSVLVAIGIVWIGSHQTDASHVQAQPAIPSASIPTVRKILASPSPVPTAARTAEPMRTPRYIATPPAPSDDELADWQAIGNQVIADLGRIADGQLVTGSYSRQVRDELTAIIRGQAPEMGSEENPNTPPDTEIVGADLSATIWKSYGVYEQGTTNLLDPDSWRAITGQLAGTVRLRSKSEISLSRVSPSFNFITVVLHKTGAGWEVHTVTDNYSLRTPDLGSLDPRDL